MWLFVATSFPGSLILPPLGQSIAPGGGKMRDPGNEVVFVAWRCNGAFCFSHRTTGHRVQCHDISGTFLHFAAPNLKAN